MNIFLFDYEQYKEVFDEELVKRGAREKVKIDFRDLRKNDLIRELSHLEKSVPEKIFDAYFIHALGRDELDSVVDFKTRHIGRRFFIRVNLGPTFDYRNMPGGLVRYGGQRDVYRYLDEMLAGGAKA
ncbi:MAG: hypothetical protein AABX35_01835 [Nanoarchaeota archaeon]